MKYHVAKQHSTPKPDVTFKFKLCYQELPGFYTLRQHKNTQHGFPIKSANVDLDDIIEEFNDANLKKELRSSKHFFVDFELKTSKHKVFNSAIENLIAKSVDEKPDHFFNDSKCAAKMNLDFRICLKTIEDG